MSIKYNIQEILEHVNCLELAEYLGIEQMKRGKHTFIRCPEHFSNTGRLEDRIDNCVLDEKGYYCFSCLAKGNAISLVCHFLQVDFKAACKEISKFMGDEQLFQMNNEQGINYMPFSSKELRLLELNRNVHIENPKEWSTYKIPNDEIPFGYKRLYQDHVTEDGEPEYLYGTEDKISLEQLYQEEPEVFLELLKGKLKEKEELLQFMLDTDFLEVLNEAYEIPYATYQIKLRLKTEWRECIQLHQKIDVLEKRLFGYQQASVS